MIIFAGWVFAVGAMMGSVANAVIYRLPKNISWSRGRSICPKCKHELKFWDLIPLLSYLLLKVQGPGFKVQAAACRYCHKPIGMRYFLVELVMAIGFWVIFNFYFLVFNQLSILNILILCGIWWVTVVIAVMDWETRLVSEKLVVVWGVLVLILQILQYSNNTNITGLVVGLVVAVGLIGGIWAVSRGKAMGFGDVEIAVVMGWWLGWPRVVIGLWIAFVIGAIVGSWQLAVGKKNMKSQIAFGPFLVLGSWIGYGWGERILHLIFSF